MNENPDDVRQNLYEEFLSEVVRNGNTEAYFDEADLIEIYDYSSDMNNYIAKMEVLLYGARHYPDSQPLATRRAWFYSSLGENEAAANLNSRVSNGGVLNRLLDLYAEEPLDTAETRAKLMKIVEETTDFADEELIQLVDFCAEARLFDWIEENYKLIKSKCSYPQTFIYEFANTLEEAGDLVRPIELFEELTMLEPFTLDFWERLCEAQYRGEQYDAAISSADYALALSPDSTPATRVKALSMYALNKPVEETIKLLEEVYDKPESTETEIGVLVGMLAMTGKFEDAVSRIKTYLTTHPVSRSVLNLLVTLEPAEAVPYVRDMMKPTHFPTFSVLDWATEEYLGENRSLCGPIALVMKEVCANPSEAEAAFMVEAFCVTGLFENAAEIGDMIDFEDCPGLLTRPGFAYSYILSLIRLKRFDDAKTVAQKAMKAIDAHEVPGENMATDKLQCLTPVTAMIAERGLSLFLFRILRVLESPDRIDPATFAPVI